MEKKRLRKRDILRMDGLLPPTRRLPVCDAVSTGSDKKKDKKWSIGGIIRRISSIKDYDSSSNDEEIVYCKKTPRKPIQFSKQNDSVVLHSIANNSEHKKWTNGEDNIRCSTNSPNLRRDSLHSRSSDGSLDGLGKKVRKNKVKARAEAKRDHLGDTSSDEDCRKSNNSLNRFHNTDVTQNSQKNNVSNRKTRAARTERYIKRLFKDEGNGNIDIFNDSHKTRLEHIENPQCTVYVHTNGSCRPPIHPRRYEVHPNNHVLPIQKCSAENLRDIERETRSSGDLRCSIEDSKYHAIDADPNNTYEQTWRIINRDTYVDSCKAGNFFTYPAKNTCHYPEPTDYIMDCRLNNSNNQPPEPPPRDPRYHAFGFGYNSYPINKAHNVPRWYKQEQNRMNSINPEEKSESRNLPGYGSNKMISFDDIIECKPDDFISINSELIKSHNSLECINNKYNSSYHHTNKPIYKETPVINCQRKKTGNDYTFNDTNYNAHVTLKNKSTNIEPRKYETVPRVASSDWLSLTSRQQIPYSITSNETYDVNIRARKSKKEENEEIIPTEEEKRRNSKNLEEALFELEEIYTSLRLGDEDLLDRAERRSMEEFNLKQSKNEVIASADISDLLDRTKDDMAYRRMHPKERPASLSDIAGQSALSNISYLIASPILSRKDSTDNFARISSCYSAYRGEPDVTRDDVVFRSINHANNTLKVLDPQPPFGIPLGPVTSTTESDYLHKIPSKSEQPRSPYIPQSEPDVVMDDLAYRTLRKDMNATKNLTENKTDILQEPAINCMKKKRAIRSLSANLYGLINHDRIHLKREPSFDSTKHKTQDDRKNFAATSEQPNYLRYVMSDGELSDNDACRRRELAKFDINGNHSTVYRNEQCINVPPTNTARKQKETRSCVAEPLPDTILSSESVLDDKFWHGQAHSDSNTSTHSGRSTEADFAVYSRLCQDLLNLIKDEDDEPPNKMPNTEDTTALITTDKSLDNFDLKLEFNEPPSINAHSKDNCYLEPKCVAHAKSKHIESENVQTPCVSPINSTESLETVQTKNFDFYMQVADENVKLIAEAFGSVADHIRYNRLSVRKNSSASYGSEIENQSESTRSSTLYSQDDANNEQILPTKLERIRASSKSNSLISDEGDQDKISHLTDISTVDAEMDLSIAYRDLQLAAASLCEHEEEINQLGIRKISGKENAHDDITITATDNADEKNEKGLILPVKHDALKQKQEQERDQEETLVLPSGVEMRSDAREDNYKGEHRVCELNRKLCYVENLQSDGMCVSCVTNLIAISVTTYSMILLACFFALLLAILAAS